MAVTAHSHATIIPYRPLEAGRTSRCIVEGKDLRKAGLKVTLPRLKILEILEHSTTRHMSAEEIYKKLLDSSEDIGLATVYRVLTQFEGAGLVTRHHFEDGMAVFEINHGTHHDHIVCMDCGAVEEFVDPDIETRQNAIAQAARVTRSRSTRWCSTGAASGPTARRASGRVKRAIDRRRRARALGSPAVRWRRCCTAVAAGRAAVARRPTAASISRRARARAA